MPISMLTKFIPSIMLESVYSAKKGIDMQWGKETARIIV